MDLLVIGSGLSGAVVAHKYAKAGKKVVILEKREHVAGNIYDHKIDGILVHKYGPHIYHSNNEKASKFMESFWELNDFRNKVEGYVQGELVPIPFNFVGIERFWPEKAMAIKDKLISKYGKDSRVGIMELLNQDDEDLKEVASFVYKNVFENYTTKMWGISPTEIDKSVMARVPVIIGYQDTYFSDKYEGLPWEGFTTAIERMLDHPNIEVRLNVNAVDVLEVKETKIFFEDLEVTCPIIYTGPLDELFAYEFGVLDYRSLDITFETLHQDKLQNTAVVNYPAHPEMTRISEYKNMTHQVVKGKTVISREFPGKFELDSERFGTPYYPMMTDDSRNKYNKYMERATKFPHLVLLGRLATYKYLNMDQAIALALETAEKLLGDDK